MPVSQTTVLNILHFLGSVARLLCECVLLPFSEIYRERERPRDSRPSLIAQSGPAVRWGQWGVEEAAAPAGFGPLITATLLIVPNARGPSTPTF